MPRIIALALVALICLSFKTYSQDGDDIAERFEKKQWALDGDFELDYYTFTPEAEKPAEGYPLIVALHGTSELIDFLGPGSHLTSREIVAGWANSDIQETYGPYILAPQVSSDNIWSDENVQEAIRLIIEALVEGGVVDSHRVYLTGHSIGGMGAWLLPVNLSAVKFAAIAPMSGFWDEDNAGLTLAEAAQQVFTEIPVWAFHHFNDLEGGNDTRGIVTVLETNGMSFVKNNEPADVNLADKHIYTEYTQATFPCSGVRCHQVCDVAVLEPVFVEWLFSQRSVPLDPDAIKITDVDTDSPVSSISWEAVHGTDQVTIYFQPENEVQWIEVAEVLAGTEHYKFETPIPATTATGKIRLDIFDSSGIRYGTDMSGIVTLNVEIITGIDPSPIKHGIKVWPNPVQDQLFLEGATDGLLSGFNYTIWDLQGKVVRQTKTADAFIPVSILDRGTYLLKLTGSKYNHPVILYFFKD